MGGKKALRAIIYKIFPKDYGRYIEVFGGGGWVLFGKLPEQKGLEVYNDFNSNLVNLFYCVKSRTMAFLQQLGYSFLPDGRYAAGVWLCSEQEVMDYIELQKPYQHRIMICDRNDFCILEMQAGQIIYPDEEAMEAFRQETENGGMTMT